MVPYLIIKIHRISLIKVWNEQGVVIQQKNYKTSLQNSKLNSYVYYSYIVILWGGIHVSLHHLNHIFLLQLNVTGKVWLRTVFLPLVFWGKKSKIKFASGLFPIGINRSGPSYRRHRQPPRAGGAAFSKVHPLINPPTLA